MKTYRGMEVYLHAFLTLALGGGDWSASRPNRCTRGVRVPGTRWTGGWLSSQSRSGRDGEEKNLLPLPRIEAVSSNLYPSHYID